MHPDQECAAAVTGRGERGCAEGTSPDCGASRRPSLPWFWAVLPGPHPCSLVTPCSSRWRLCCLQSGICWPHPCPQPGTAQRGQLCTPHPTPPGGRGLHFHCFHHLSFPVFSPARAPSHRALGSVIGEMVTPRHVAWMRSPSLPAPGSGHLNRQGRTDPPRSLCQKSSAA